MQAEVRVCPTMLTDFTVSVVFLYGVVFGEADPSHPLYAFGGGESRNLSQREQRT